MKKFALALTAAAAVILGSAGVVDAYPPGGQQVVVSDTTIEPGETFTVTVECVPDETVTFIFGDIVLTQICRLVINAGNNLSDVANGTASATFTAPTEPGSYTGTATGSISGLLGSFSVVVEAETAGTPGTPATPAGSLPATGSDGIGSTTMMAGGLLVVGLGMFGVASVRRRQTVAA